MIFAKTPLGLAKVMALSLAYRTNRPADFYVVFSRLQAGGFHPFTPNLEHGTLVAGYIMALGGFDILLPEQEFEGAKIWMSDIEPLEEYDPIKERPIRDIFQASVLTRNPFFAVICLPPEVLLGLWVLCVGLLWITGDGSLFLILFLTSGALCIIGILAHARYLARQRQMRIS